MKATLRDSTISGKYHCKYQTKSLRKDIIFHFHSDKDKTSVRFLVDITKDEREGKTKRTQANWTPVLLQRNVGNKNSNRYAYY